MAENPLNCFQSTRTKFMDATKSIKIYIKDTCRKIKTCINKQVNANEKKKNIEHCDKKIK